MLVLSFYVTTIGADAPGCVESLFVVGQVSLIAVTVGCTLIVCKEQISIVLGLSSFAGSRNLDFVYACLKGYLEAVDVSTNQEIVAPKCLLLVVERSIQGGIPTIREVNSGLSVNGNSCFTIGCILQSDVDSEIINACLFSNYIVKQIAVCLVTILYIEVRIGNVRRLVSGDFIILAVRSGGDAISLCVNMENALCSELLRKHVSHGEYVVLLIVIEIKDGGYFHGNGSFTTVLALAVFNDVLVLFFNATTIKANTPSCVESLFVVDQVFLIAVNVRSLVDLCGSGQNFITNAALFASGSAIIFTCGLYCRDCNLSMVNLADGFSLSFVTSTGKGSNTFFGASSFLGYNTGTPLVYVRRNVVGINCATSTLAIFAVGVSNYGDSFGLGFAAFAGVGLNAFCGAGCRSGFNAITPCVYVRRNIVGVGFTALTCAFYKIVFVSRLSSLGSSNFCGLFSCCFYRSSSLGSFTEQLVEHITRSDSEHHSNGKNQSQNAQNVLVFHT